MTNDKYYQALRRIAIALRDWDDWDVINTSEDCERLQQRYVRHQRQGMSVVESAIEARAGFMAEVLANLDGHHFGSILDDAHNIKNRVCNDEFGNRWRGSTPDEGMNIGSKEAADAKPQ